MEAKLLLIPWMVSVLYSSIPLFWFAIHPFAHSWRRMNRSPYLYLLPLWLVVISALAAITWPFHELQLYYPPHHWWTVVAGFAGVLAGLSLTTYWRIRSSFGIQNFIGASELHSQDETANLVTTGIHARMRHPIYVAHLLMLSAWSFASGLLVPCFLLALSAFITFPLMIWAEERELEQRFGVSYRDYKKKVPAFAMPLFHPSQRKKPA
ncbi:MAG: isoprenylcysteine carboxylmethyltransferase family protein [Candidatus Angelobacter sp.]